MSRHCTCLCHSMKGITHVIPCCISDFRTLESTIKPIVESAVSDIIRVSRHDAEAKRQKEIQAAVERDVKAVADADDSQGVQKIRAEDENPLSQGAPKRDTQSPAVPNAQQDMKQPAEQQAEQIDADAIIDKFNIIRSGRSLNDRDIKDLMKKYLGSLSDSQRGAVFGILQRIGTIVAPAVDAQRLHAPPEEPSAVKDARLQMLQQKRTAEKDVKNVAPPSVEPKSQTMKVKAQSSDAQKNDDEEDNSPPIRVGARTSETIKRRNKLID